MLADGFKDTDTDSLGDTLDDSENRANNQGTPAGHGNKANNTSVDQAAPVGESPRSANKLILFVKMTLNNYQPKTTPNSTRLSLCQLICRSLVPQFSHLK